MWLQDPKELERMEGLGLGQRNSVLPNMGPMGRGQRTCWQYRGPS